VILGFPLPELRDGLHDHARKLIEAGRTLKQVKTHKVIKSVWKADPSRSPLELYAFLLRMSQNWIARYPLFETQGNFGSIDGDPPTGMRYNEVWPSSWGLQEGVFPQLLVNGGFAHSGAIETDAPRSTEADPEFMEPLVSYCPTGGLHGGVLRSFLPPHNLKEVAGSLLLLLENPDARLQDLIKVLRGPDFPTGGILMNPQDLEGIYRTGEGTLVVRARTSIGKGSQGESRITLHDVPYGTSKRDLLKGLTDMAKTNQGTRIADLLDLSTREQVNIEIVLQRDQPPRALIDFLSRSQILENRIEVWMHVAKDGKEMRISLLDLLRSHLTLARRRAGSERRLRVELRSLAEQSDARRTEIAGGGPVSARI